jgi:hypothetical protein
VEGQLHCPPQPGRNHCTKYIKVTDLRWHMLPVVSEWLATPTTFITGIFSKTLLANQFCILIVLLLISQLILQLPTHVPTLFVDLTVANWSTNSVHLLYWCQLVNQFCTLTLLLSTGQLFLYTGFTVASWSTNSVHKRYCYQLVNQFCTLTLLMPAGQPFLYATVVN